MRNAKKTLSLVMVAIFTTFIVLSGLPTAAATISAAAKAQGSKATYYVVKAESVASTYSVAVAKNQYAVAVKEIRALRAFGAPVAAQYASLSARVVMVNKLIAARVLALANAVSADLVAAEALVVKAEDLTNTDTYDLVGVEADLANAQNAVTDALEGIVKLDKDSAGYKGLMARVDAANAKIISAMDQIQVLADQDAQAKAVVAAEAAVKAVEAAAATAKTDADVLAGAPLGVAAQAAVAAIEDPAVAKGFADRLAVVADLAKKILAAPVVSTVSAVDGTITVTFDKTLKGAISVPDLKVTRTVTTDVAVTTNVAVTTVTTAGAVVTIPVPVIAATATPQAVVYTVAYGTTTTSAVAYTVAALPAVGVASAAAVIATEITVVFNQAVDKTTAETIGNYKLNGAAFATGSTVALQADGKSVVITLAATLSTSLGYVVTVDGVKSLDTLRAASAAKSPAFVFVADTTAPVLLSAAAKALVSTTSVTATFSEPVKGQGFYTINGVAVIPTLNPIPSKTVTLATGTLVPGTVYTLQVINEKDGSDNLNSPNPASVTFSVTLANAAPTVAVKTTGDKQVNLTFTTTMDPLTMLAANVKLLDSNLENINGLLTASVSITQGTDATMWNLNISGATFNSAKQLPLTLVVTAAVKDSLGNAMAATTVPVVLTQDVVAPVVLKGEYVKPGTIYDKVPYANGAVVLTLSEAVSGTTVPDAILTTVNTVAITNLGVDESALKLSGLAGVFSSVGKNIVVYPLTAGFTATTTETLRFAAGTFKDASMLGNSSVAQVVAVNVAAPVADSATTSDVTKPVLSIIGVATGNIISVSLGLDTMATMDATTVLNTNNYILNAQQLPVGTYITTNASGNVIYINLPTGSVAATASKPILITGIKDLAGNLADPVPGNVALVDNIKPVMTSLVFNADGTMTVGFSESILATSVPQALGGDFTISSSLSTPGTFWEEAGVGADAGKIVIHFTPAVATGEVLTVTVTANPATTDAAGNVITTGTVLKITK